MNKKVLLSVAIFLSIIMLLAGCGSSNNSQNANSQEVGNTPEAKTFKVGLECDYPPFNWTQLDDSNGAVPIDGCAEYAAGYDVEIAKGSPMAWEENWLLSKLNGLVFCPH